MSVEIPVSVVYSIPAIPVFIFGWFSQVFADRRVRDLTGVDAKISADEALSKFLKSVKLENVEIVRSENYTQNEYVEDENKIYLSPDTLQHSDVSSVAFALRAGAQAAFCRVSPQKSKASKALHKAETIAFWLTFSVLAFGVMSTSAPLTIIGYLLGFSVFACWRLRWGILREIDESALLFAESRSIVDRTTFENIKKVLDAERRKF